MLICYTIGHIAVLECSLHSLRQISILASRFVLKKDAEDHADGKDKETLLPNDNSN